MDFNQSIPFLVVAVGLLYMLLALIVTRAKLSKYFRSIERNIGKTALLEVLHEPGRNAVFVVQSILTRKYMTPLSTSIYGYTDSILIASKFDSKDHAISRAREAGFIEILTAV